MCFPKTSVLSTQSTNIPADGARPTTAAIASAASCAKASTAEPPPRPPPPDIPKSPPKWPLRPGVLVHVKVDTKHNLCASRTQSPNTSLLSAANTSSLLNNDNNTQNASLTAAAAAVLMTADAALDATETKPSTMVMAKTTTILGQATSQDSGTPTTNYIRSGNNDKGNSNGGIHNLSIQKQPSDMPQCQRIGANTEHHQLVSPNENKSICDKSLLNANLDINDNNNDNDISRVGLIEVCANHNGHSNNNNNDELVSFTTSNLIERILGRLRWRRERAKPPDSVSGNGAMRDPNIHRTKNTQNNEESLFAKNNKRAVNLLRSTGWFGSGKSTNSTTELMFDKRNHISGITCSDGGKCSHKITMRKLIV